MKKPVIRPRIAGGVIVCRKVGINMSIIDVNIVVIPATAMNGPELAVAMHAIASNNKTVPMTVSVAVSGRVDGCRNARSAIRPPVRQPSVPPTKPTEPRTEATCPVDQLNERESIIGDHAVTA